YPKSIKEKPPSFKFFNIFKFDFSGVKEEALKTIKSYFSSGGRYEGLVKVLLIQATILPLFAYLVTLNLTRRLAEVLGGEIDFSTLVRLI
ncbi:MAG: hypothetical protein NZ903_00995, partial [Candidatus Micrarchaeota archaeon]|nr:hypothetical protein [Candidatus Micrarchaeota archaeon]